MKTMSCREYQPKPSTGKGGVISALGMTTTRMIGRHKKLGPVKRNAG